MKKPIPIIVLAGLFIAACLHFSISPKLPEDVPTIPGSRVLSRTIYSENPPAKQWVIEIDGKPRDLFDFYKEKLKEKGWTVRVELQDFMALCNKNSGMMITPDHLPDGGTRAELYIKGI